MIPDQIQFDQISLGERGRTTYNRIEELAQSIKDNGLIQPIVLVPLPDGRYGLDAGGRRYHALKLLGASTLFHAATSNPDRPGFVMKGEDQTTALQRILTEIAENLDREDVDWRDSMKLLTKAFRLSQSEAYSRGEEILMRDFGAMLGCGYSELQAAVAIHDDVIANPTRYKDCTGIRNAYTLLLKSNADEINRLAAAKSLGGDTTIAVKTSRDLQRPVSAQDEPERKVNIVLSEYFKNINSLEYLLGMTTESVDHIITDPDYGIDVGLLSSNMGSAATGVHQESIEHSLADMKGLIAQAWRVIKPQGFLVFWYDLDHHEKLQNMARGVGFAVQRWPLIWVKTDYRSNAAPAHNFCKNIEYAMVCRKPSAVLARAQMSSVFSAPTGDVTKTLGHPFAKPFDLWTWIYAAVCIKGQTVFDPFVGAGSSAIAAMKWGLRPMGCEINPDHYANLIMNLQSAYKQELGNIITFS